MIYDGDSTATVSGNTMWTGNGTVTMNGNTFHGPDGVYTLSNGILYGPNGQSWSGVNNTQDAMNIIAHKLK